MEGASILYREQSAVITCPKTTTQSGNRHKPLNLEFLKLSNACFLVVLEVEQQ